MKIALCLSGQPRSFEKGYEYHYKNIIENNDVDVFIHCWDTKYENQLVELYKPKKYSFEKQIIFDEQNKRQHIIESRWYSAKQVNDLKKQYEADNNFKYDFVMSSRFDVGIFKNLDFNDYKGSTGMYIPKSNPPNMNQPTILDYWYFSTSENMDIINNFHTKWKEYGCRTPHKDLYQWPTDNDIDIFMLPQFEESEKGNGNTDIIRAVFQNCEYKDEFIGIENLQKLSKYPRGSRF